jgi:hypothetical protein
VAKASEHSLRGQQLDPRRSQLYGEGQPVEVGADLRHRQSVIVGHGEVGLHSFGPLYEEPHPFVLSQVLYRLRMFRVG